MKWIREIGPGILIAAAFIGPGTVTLCTIAGVSYGYSLIWALVLSIFATIFLQELSLRVGLVTNMNVAEVISKSVKSVYINKFLIVLIVSSILIGNAAYEAGNITGASLASGVIEVEAIPDSNDVIALKDLYLQLDVSNSTVKALPDVVSSGENTSATSYVTTSSYASESIYTR